MGKERDASQAAAVAERTLHETGRTLLLGREQECFRRLLQSLRGMLEGLQDILRTLVWRSERLSSGLSRSLRRAESAALSIDPERTVQAYIASHDTGERQVERDRGGGSRWEETNSDVDGERQ